MKPQSEARGGLRYWVPMVGHAFRALEILCEARGGMTLTEVSERVCVGKTSTLRILQSLATMGYVYRDPETGKYELATKIIHIAHKAMPNPVLLQTARPYLRHLHDLFNETVNLAVLWKNEAVYVDVHESTHSFRTAGDVGERAPMHATALGKAIAAFLPPDVLHAALNRDSLAPLTHRTITTWPQLAKEYSKIREQRYALDIEEQELGACCVGAPILNRDNEAVAAISVSGPIARIRARQRRIAHQVKTAANSISKLLHARRSP